jgi:hypothetical protein
MEFTNSFDDGEKTEKHTNVFESHRGLDILRSELHSILQEFVTTHGNEQEFEGCDRPATMKKRFRWEKARWSDVVVISAHPSPSFTFQISAHFNNCVKPFEKSDLKTAESMPLPLFLSGRAVVHSSHALKLCLP